MKHPRVFISNYPFARYDKSPLERLQEAGISIEINPYGRKMRPEESAEAAAGFDAIIAGTEDLTPLIQKSDRLKFVARIGIGLDSVPLELCRLKGVAVSYTPDAVTASVVELAVGLMLASTRKITLADRALRTGDWSRPFGRRLGESTIGIIGLGRTGSEVIWRLGSFSPQEILVNDTLEKSALIKEFCAAGLKVRHTSKEEIFQKSDLISLHVPLTPQTRALVNKTTLASMQPHAHLLNLSRGEIVDEEALYEALSGGVIEGAAIDVFAKEPYKGALCELENVTLTQHMGACTYDGRLAMEKEAVEEVVRFFGREKLRSLVPDEEYELQALSREFTESEQ